MIPIAGLVPFTTIDFPGHLAAVVFTQGCEWNCQYCHNQTLRPYGVPSKFSVKETMDWIEKRKGFVDGIVISGGEPTMHGGLRLFIEQIKALDLAVGLHTNGSYPARFSRVLPLLDWVGFDYKAPSLQYVEVTKSVISHELVEPSLKHLVASGKAYEIRTTWHPSYLPVHSLPYVADELVQYGVTNWTIQLAQGYDTLPDDILKAIIKTGLDIAVR